MQNRKISVLHGTSSSEVMLPLNFTGNLTDWNDTLNGQDPPSLKWGMLSLMGFIFLTATGNILVCLAVCWERRLQNMTNYFLMSLAIADLLVAILVMPLGMVVEIFNGYFPLGPHFCTLWVTFDVGLCTASIWHMCTMSMDRFFTLKYPMKYGRNKTKTMVALKITFVWVASIAVCSPVCFLGFIDSTNVYDDGFCVPTMKNFIIYGSVFAFYVPLLIMVVTYVLTLQILRNNSKFMRKMEKSRTTVMRKHVAGYHTNKSNRYLAPNGYSNNYENEISGESALASKEISENSGSCDPLSDTKCSSDFTAYTMIQPFDKKNKPSPIPITLPVLPDESEAPASPPWEPTTPLCEAASPIFRKKDRMDSITSAFSGKSFGSNPSRSKSYLSLPVGSRHNLSASVESLVSIHGPGIIHERPEVQDKLSQIEIEMETYLTTEGEGEGEGLQRTDSDKEISSGSDSAFQDDPIQTQNRTDSESSESVENPECQALNPSPRDSGSDKPDTPENPTTEGEETEEEAGENHVPSDHELLTLSIKANGMYVYRVKYSKSSNQINEYIDDDDPTYAAKSRPTVESPARLEVTDFSTMNCRLPKSRSCSEVYLKGTNMELMREITERRASAQRMLDTRYKESLQQTKSQRPNNFNKKKRKKIMRSFIPKRTANNEKKASKVLGIIFGVFVILWTPFFTLNVMSVTCEVCMTNVTAEIMSSVLWFGWIASLANPIIYTMFNTSFRHAFYKILTCKYKRRERVAQTPESVFLTSPSNWINSDTRRNTVTMQLN